jgi:hypothetical protein
MHVTFRTAVSIVAMLGLVHPALAGTKLSGIFQFDLLNAEIAYLESIAGPAIHIHANGADVQAREYRVDGCRVTAYAKGSEAIAYALDLTPKCNFNMGDLLGNFYGSTRGLTIGTFGAGAFGAHLRAQSACISLCGNAADPSVDFTWEGPHAANFVSIVLTVTLADDASVEAGRQWAAIMQKQEGDDYVSGTKFNCDNRYDDAAFKAFGKVKVTRIAIGYYEPNADAYNKNCGK